MAAPQIPNLSTLRTGSGRGRARGRAQESDDNPSAPSSEGRAAKDEVVQHTDIDASGSRLSAVELGYLEDPFAKLFVSTESQRRFPIINRGTYVRTRAIDNLVDLFLSNLLSVKKQIISLGAGSDTRFFRIVQRDDPDLDSREPNLRTNLIYHEFDFPENTAKKKAIINRTSILRSLVGTPYLDHEAGLDGSNYHLHPVDLRSLDTEAPVPDSFRYIDPTLPTAIISECCLVYLDPTLADKAARYFTQFLFPQSTAVGMILYEPINPNDAFGKVMVSNLATRGIVLQTLRKYGSLEAQAARMKAYGFDSSGGVDVGGLWQKGVDEEEKGRVAALEMVDEVEEWELLAGHYCVVWGWRGDSDGATWDGWKKFEMQMKLRSVAG